MILCKNLTSHDVKIKFNDFSGHCDKSYMHNFIMYMYSALNTDSVFGGCEDVMCIINITYIPDLDV